MAHARQTVRDAAVTDLTGLGETGSNVFSSRVSPLQASEMPGWYVMLRDENGSEEGALDSFEREGNLVIEGWAVGGDGLEDTLDTMAAEAEAAIYAADGAVRALLVNFGAPRTQIELPSGEDAAARIGKVRILFPVTYRTSVGDPTAII